MKGTLWIWVGVLVVFLAGSSFVGYKLWNRYRGGNPEEQRWEVKMVMNLNTEPSAEEMEKYLAIENEKLDRYEVLRPIVDELDLINVWGVADVDEAMARLRECAEIRAGDQPGAVHFVVTDKDQEMAGKLGQAVAKSYKAMIVRESLRIPVPPPGYKE